MVEEFELEGAVASAAELSPTPQLSISLIEGLPGRAMVTYPVRTAAGDAGTAVALWDVAGKRPLARWEVGVPQSSTTPNVSSPCPGAFPPRSLTWDWFCQAPWILGKTGLVDTEQDELLVAAVGTPSSAALLPSAASALLASSAASDVDCVGCRGLHGAVLAAAARRGLRHRQGRQDHHSANTHRVAPLQHG